jgi:catechol 2,3-dioxygenase-like lactoylglutathione lyase family enzyme
MRIEHIAINVKAPKEMARWYCDHLGMQIARDTGKAFFIADENKNTILEIYNNPPDGVPDYASMDPLLLHIAFSSNDVGGDRKRLIEAGAAPVGEVNQDNGDTFAVVRDPWGVAIQLVKRKISMLKT